MIDLSRKLRNTSVAALVLLVTMVLAAGPSYGGPSDALGTRPATATKPIKAGRAEAGPTKAGPEGKGPTSHSAGSEQGIVQSVSMKAVVLKALDGSVVTVFVVPSTRVFVDGVLASLHDVKPGFVAVVSWKAGKPARELQIFDLSGQNDAGVATVESVSTGAVVVREASGSTVTIRVNAKTRVLVDGKRATLQAVKSGDTVVIIATHSKGNRPARELRFLRPG